jgi:hypothetical protein
MAPEREKLQHLRHTSGVSQRGFTFSQLNQRQTLQDIMHA